MSKKTLADLHQEEQFDRQVKELKTMILELEGKKYEIELPAYFKSKNEDGFVKIDEAGNSFEVFLGFKYYSLTKDLRNLGSVYNHFDIATEEEWDFAVSELKIKINSI